MIFKDWHFNHQEGYLKHLNEIHKLPPRLSKLLFLLTSQAGQLVERQDIIEALWSGKVVNDDALARCIAELRSLLGDKSQSPIYIETIPRRGYRFIAEVKPLTTKPKNKTLAFFAVSALVLVLLAYWGIQRHAENDIIDWREVIAQGVRVTAEAQMEIQPELSSNGRSLTYSIKENNTFVIKVVDLTGKQKFHISAPDAYLLSPVLSPKEDRLLAIEYASDGCKVVLFDLPELSKQALTDCALPNRSGVLEWTKQGDGFVFVKSNNNKLSTSIWLYDLSTQSEKPMTDKPEPDLFDTRPRISPDGKFLSFHRGTGSIQNIYVQDINNPSSLKQVTFGKNRKLSHQWTVDSRSLLFDSNIRGDKNLWLVNLSTEKMENLGGKDGQYPMLSQDGKVFAYQEARYQANLWLHDLNTATKTRIIASPKYDNHPAYAPDGKSFAFATNKYGYSAIWLYDFALQQQRLLLSIPNKSLLSPQWSPSGEKLLFSAVSDQGYQCFELVIKTGLYQQVKDDSLPISNCIYASEQHILAISKYQGKAPQVISLLEDGTSEQLTNEGASRVKVLDKDTYIYTHSDQKGLFRYSVEKQLSSVLIDDFPLSFFEFWEVSGNKIYYLHWEKSNQLWVYDIATQSHQKVLDSLNIAVGGVISISPDGSKIILSEQGHNQGNIFVTDLDMLN